MAHDWSDLFITPDGAPAPAAADTAEAEPERRRGIFRRLRENMSKTRTALSAEVQATLFSGDLDEETWERLEEALIYADVGARTTAEVVGTLEQEAEAGDVVGGEALTARLIELLAEIAKSPGAGRIDVSAAPAVLLMVGVNGTGKTTTVGKVAWHLRKELGLEVVLGAADTYRAAAVEQLEVWSQRAGVHFVKGAEGADPGSVAYDAVATGVREGADVVMVDTAGRLHTQDDLMAELTKVRRVIAKQLPGAPHETLLDRRRHDRSERPAPGQALLRGGRGHGDRPDQARRHGQGRDRPGDRQGARDPGQADRHGGGAGGPAPLRSRRLRACDARPD